MKINIIENIVDEIYVGDTKGELFAPAFECNVNDDLPKCKSINCIVDLSQEINEVNICEIIQNEQLLKKFSVEQLIYLIQKIKLINNKHDNYVFDKLEQKCVELNLTRAKLLSKFILSRCTTADINYRLVIIILLLMHLIIFFVDNYLFHIITIVGFLSQNLFKMFLFCTSIVYVKDRALTLSISDNDLPIYSILLPLYKEENKIISLIRAMDSLNYPKDKMDVKIIVEADDSITINKIEQLQLNDEMPSFIEVIKVGIDTLRTKPKALNYALPYCRGEFIVIYDAEDIPDSNQLLEAVKKFKLLSSEYGCLQAKLNFYNSDENILTKFMSIEYGIWFNYLLKGLEILKLPVPLGGTSNHFKRNILEQIGMWDPYNVAEDAELGIRLHSFGYRVAVLDSYTLEEGTISIDNWIKQRARWIKGYIQTILVFLYNSKTGFKYKDILTISLLIGLSSYSFFALPWVLLKIGFTKSIWVCYIWIINSFFGLSYIYSTNYYFLTKDKINNEINKLQPNVLDDIINETAIDYAKLELRTTDFRCITGNKVTKCSDVTSGQFVYKNDTINIKGNILVDHPKSMDYIKARLKRLLLYSSVILFPLYFVLHTCASYRAIWELLVRPFIWDKTIHGVSKYKFYMEIIQNKLIFLSKKDNLKL